MSWFKINVNDSLNTIKGQISNVSNVVHDVFTEGISDENKEDTAAKTREDEESLLTALESANAKIDELSTFCQSKDDEISKLYQQILQLQSGTNVEAPVLLQTGIQKSKANENDQTDSPSQQKPIDESWFWESEKTPSSASSKENEPRSNTFSESSGNLVKAAENTKENERRIETLRRTIDEKSSQIIQFENENSDLKSSIETLRNENTEISLQIELLDQQHSEAIERMITVKNEVQSECSRLENELKVIKSENEVKYQKLSEEKVLLLQENKELLDKNAILEEQCIKSLEGSVVLSGDEREKEGSDKFELIDIYKDSRSNSLEVTRLQTELDEINEKLAILNDIKDQYDLNVVKLGAVVDEKNKLNEQLQKYKNENSRLLEEVQVTREAVEKLEVLQQNLDEINSDKEQNELAFSTLQEDEILLQREFTHLKAEKEKEVKELEEVIQNKDVELTALETANSQLRNQLENVNIEFEKLSIEKEEYERKEQILLIESDCQTDDRSEHNGSSPDILSLDQIHSMMSKYSEVTQPQTSTTASSCLESFLSTFESTNQRLKSLEQDQKDLKAQFEKVTKEKENLQHEQLTLRADLSYYETEVAELMKNNEILLVELENIKTGKLETISEHNEDNILRLEKHLDDSNKLAQSLEKELRNVQLKIAETEEEKVELSEANQSLETKLKEQIQRYETLKKETDEQIQLNQKEKLSSRNEEVSQLTKQLDNLETDYKLLVEQFDDVKRDKENCLLEIEKLKEYLENEQENYERLQQEHLQIQDKLDKSSQDLEGSSESNAEQVAKIESIKQNLEKTTHEKNDLIAAVQLKHEENVKYHHKLQELSQALNALRSSVEANKTVPCKECEQLTKIIREADGKIINLTEQIEFLNEKCDRFTESLLLEQANIKKMNEEKSVLEEEKQTMEKDLTRLRGHLIDLENTHTAEIYELQNVIDSLKQKMSTVRAEAEKSSTAYTSASIRANQHTETLQAQYAVLQQQKEELAAKLGAAEDRESKNQASLINLQCALELFQKEKDKDIGVETHRIKKQLNDEISKQTALLKEIESLKCQLAKSEDGLLAAARISDQLEIAQVTNAALKEELRKTQDKFHALEQKISDYEGNQADRVDKSLVKNLFIGYCVSPSNDKPQILKLISTVLDFNKSESDKVGLNKNQAGWLSSVFQADDSRNDNYSKDGLALAFVKFLENESQKEPLSAPTLLNIVHTTSALTSSTSHPHTAITATSTSGESQTTQTQSLAHPLSISQPVFLQQHDTFTSPRNSSSILKDVLNDS